MQYVIRMVIVLVLFVVLLLYTGLLRVSIQEIIQKILDFLTP